VPSTSFFQSSIFGAPIRLEPTTHIVVCRYWSSAPHADLMMVRSHVSQYNQKKLKKKITLIFFLRLCIGTPVYFSGMTGRGRAVILKYNVSKSCDHKLLLFFFYWDIGNSNAQWFEP
jgi:hypothetical protein